MERIGLLRDSYLACSGRSLELAAHTLVGHHDAVDTRYLLAAVANLKGHYALGDAVDRLWEEAWCPRCHLHVRCGKCGKTVKVVE